MNGGAPALGGTKRVHTTLSPEGTRNGGGGTNILLQLQLRGSEGQSLITRMWAERTAGRAECSPRRGQSKSERAEVCHSGKTTGPR